MGYDVSFHPISPEEMREWYFTPLTWVQQGQPEKVLAFYRHGLLFAFNFSPTQSLANVLVPVFNPGEYTVALSTDDDKYGGWNQIQHITYPTKLFDGKHYVELYLPARTAVVLKERVILPTGE